jgi:hypothetical protein
LTEISESSRDEESTSVDDLEGVDDSKAEESDDSEAIDDSGDDDSGEADAEIDGEVRRTRQTDAFWAKVRIDPIEIALPSGVGYTLRAYRLDTEIIPSDYAAREDLDFPDRTAAYAEDADDAEDVLDDEDVDEDLEEDVDEHDDEDADTGAEKDEDDEDDPDDEDEEFPAEEVPLFLSHGGHVLLFRSPQSLVEFVRSDAEHDLTQLDTWSRFTDGVRVEHIVPLPDDTYELDLVVKNLRASHDAWDPDLIVQSGQLARDLAHALRIEAVVLALSPGSPLDDLDEALRAVAAGGIGTFFARRKAKKIGTETASLGWRTVIGKISAVVDWRD